MIVGFNHNILYRGVGFHVQTEDGGLKSPNLVTLLYHGGTIITSQKTSYADILSVDNLNHVIEELAKEQHKGMLRRLTKGEFDSRICEFDIRLEGVQTVEKTETLIKEILTPAPLAPSVLSAPPETDASGPEPSEPDHVPQPLAIEPAFEPLSAEDRNVLPNLSEALDDLIFSYLTGGDEAR
ncbi:hypothetical protein [Geopsychrobacter electrodiphilus]|uniref:hypothetical protein n=1 Tax=Geopsychrobacter electrodiphilus TaxID=225196 RepID=UPI0012EBAC29|nr:hypothetical protein [Geopsychrobacter electrodiphilus]